MGQQKRKFAPEGPAKSQLPPVGKISLWYRCLRKRPYSKKAARGTVAEMNKRKHRDYDVHAYICDYCQQYHVGRVAPIQDAPST